MISAPFILRPVATTLLTVALVMLGLLGYRLLPVAALPDVDFPTIQVVTSFPGASPDVVETSVTAPLEHRFGQISGLTNMSSTSAYGTSQITLTFDLSRSIDAAAQDVQASIDAAEGLIPHAAARTAGVSRGQSGRRPGADPGTDLDTLPLHEVNDYAATTIVQKLSQIGGVGAVTVEGGQTRAVRLQADVAKLAGLGLSLEDVRRAVAASTVDNAEGSARRRSSGLPDRRQRSAVFRRQLRGDGYRLSQRGACPVARYRARVSTASRTPNWRPGTTAQPAVILDIQRQPGANTIQVVEAVRALLPKLAASLPPALKVSVVTDRTTTIRAAISDVQFTLLLTVALVVLVIFLFLRKLWATVDPERCLAGVADRHVRRYGRAGLQPRQSVADGADHRVGLCGRRCDRDDREHRRATSKRARRRLPPR